MSERTQQVRDQVAPVATDFKGAAVDYASAAKEWATPRIEAGLEAARGQFETLGPALGQAKEKMADDIAPKVAAAVGAAIAASEPVRREAAARGHAAALALKGDLVVPRRKRRAGRKLLLLAVLVAGAAAVWAALRQRRSDPWAMPAETVSPLSPAPVPAPPPSPEPPAPEAAPPSSDAGGASPEEMISDEVVEPAAETKSE